MPRTREFDTKVALNAAMQVFWLKGYSEASYEDLVEGTGVSRKGLYTAFGDKHQLFLATLKNYRATVVPKMMEGLSADEVTAQNVRNTFRQLAEMASSGVGQSGCFMARTSADIAIEDPKVKAIVDAHWVDLQSRLQSALLKAGFADKRVDQLAPYFVGVLQGLFTLAHARADRNVIEPFIEEALKVLD